MGKKTGGPGRVALTKRERAAGVGAELLALIESITEDGAITKAEIIELRAWLLKNRNEKPKAIRFLTETLERILADRIVTKQDVDELYDSIVRVFPPALRDTPHCARYSMRYPELNNYGSYMALAEAYFRDKRFDAALRTLDRGLKEAHTSEKDKYDGEDWHWNYNELRKEIKIGALAYERYGEDMKGKCENCGKEPRKMYWYHTGIWICTACMKALRPPHLATYKMIKSLREDGFDVPYDITHEQAGTTSLLHIQAGYYVFDVWETLTGNRASFEFGSARCWNKFVTSLFSDRQLVQRIASVQEHRTEVAYSRMPEDKRNDGARCLYLGRYKPKMLEDDDFMLVAQKLRDEYPQFITGQKSPRKSFSDMFKIVCKHLS